MSVMRIAKRFLPLLVLLAVPLAAGSCRPLLKEAFKPPKVRVTDALLTSDPRSDPMGPWEVTLTLEVNNPNGYPLTVSHVAYTAIVGRETVAEGEHLTDIRVEASRVTPVRIPVTLRPDAFREAMRHVLQVRRLGYEFNGSVALRAPIVGIVRIPFSKTGTIDPVDLLRRKGFGFN
jgi:LEA14-like dessication related protein